MHQNALANAYGRTRTALATAPFLFWKPLGRIVDSWSMSVLTIGRLFF
jgi:hypothetical protein